ncbi:hypothetical protein QVD17_32375 [Tagetes erecta]|uniref:Peptidase A1 domain-containing protein n=1 Tax=Tagetes erecta TaxID=13708 RepID=A0AAD8NPE3_TARER|nr:hypothetical protein QVD17_32375 [Tagetes erecta]
MASSIFLASLILLHLLLSPQPAYSVSGFRATLTRVPKHMISTSTFNTERATNSLIKSPMKAKKDVYLMNLAIGTPPVTFSAIMDTGSDLIWTKCKSGGGSGLFDSSKSVTFSNINESCESLELGTDCKQDYADGTSVSVTLGRETLTIGNNKFPNTTFACGKPNGKYYSRADGIVGMGRGKLSLVSQLNERLFSYCLGSRFGPQTNGMLLAGSEVSSRKINTQTTPLRTQDGMSYYYISLEGISVGGTKLEVTKSDFAVSSNGDGGMIIDSGTTFTYLEESIVDKISNEFMRQTKLKKSENNELYYDLKHCFKSRGNVNAPTLVFHFEGANWELLEKNYIYQKDGGDMACLAFIAKNDKGVSIFGNFQQQNMLVIYDLDKSSLSFKPATNCNKL